MSWFGAIRTATGGVMRHKVQAIALSVVLLVATASATLGLALLAASNAPYQRAFAAQHGADLTATLNSAGAPSADVAATRTVRGVTASAGPFAEASVETVFAGQPNGQLTLVGRTSASEPVDQLVLNAGRWADGPGQVVLNSTPNPDGPQVGSTLSVTGVPGAPSLKVVGFANSITNSADGWVVPGQIPALLAHGAPATEELLYSFTQSATYAQLRADASEIGKALPAGAVAGYSSWLNSETNAAGNGAIMEPFVVAFALIGLVMAVLIVGNVVSGAVIAGYRRIGVLKSIGLTPAQVVVAYLSRVGWPALIGCLIGIVAGNLLAIPVLATSASAYGIGSQHVPWWAMVVAPLGMLALTMLAALGPAIRAGRLSAVEAIAAGHAPRAGRGYGAHRLAARLGLPRPVGLGLAAPFARPARTVVTLAAVAFGATAVIFAVGLTSSLSRAAASQTLSNTVQAQVGLSGPGTATGPQQTPSAAQNAAVTAALRAQPGTLHEVAVYTRGVKVPQVAGSVNASAFDNASSWLGYAIISGRWYGAPGEVDVNTAFLDSSGLVVGDTTTVNTGTAQATVHIVGEVFSPNGGPRLYGSMSTLPGMAIAQNLEEFDVSLRPGTDAGNYVQSVNNALGPHSPWGASSHHHGGKFYTVASALVGLLALMVAIAAGLGVLNTVLMTTRDRVHDLGIFKALGMRPGQVVTMVTCWIAGPAVLAGAIAAPAAVALNSATLHAMGNTAHTGVPASFTQVFSPEKLALLSLAALAIAVAGAMLPATWAARSRPATALRTE
jgi:putative ABC transport system permease protein